MTRHASLADSGARFSAPRLARADVDHRIRRLAREADALCDAPGLGGHPARSGVIAAAVALADALHVAEAARQGAARGRIRALPRKENR